MITRQSLKQNPATNDMVESIIDPPPPPLPHADRVVHERLRKQRTHSPSELAHIMAELRTIRSRLRDRPPNFNGVPYRVPLAIYGFSDVQQRNNLLWALRYAVSPHLLLCSQVDFKRWEGILVLTVRQGTLDNHFTGHTSNVYKANGDLSINTLSPRDAFVSRIADIVSLFRLSADVLDLVEWSSDSTVTCITRIEHGMYKFGSLHNHRNLTLLQAYLLRKREMEDNSRNQSVRSVTGRDFTVGNTLELFHNMRNAEQEIDRLRSHTTNVLQHLAIMENSLRVNVSSLELVAQSLHIHTVTNDTAPETTPPQANNMTTNVTNNITSNATSNATFNTPPSPPRHSSSINAPLRSPPRRQLQDVTSRENQVIPTTNSTNRRTNHPPATATRTTRNMARESASPTPNTTTPNTTTPNTTTPNTTTPNTTTPNTTTPNTTTPNTTTPNTTTPNTTTPNTTTPNTTTPNTTTPNTTTPNTTTPNTTTPNTTTPNTITPNTITAVNSSLSLARTLVHDTFRLRSQLIHNPDTDSPPYVDLTSPTPPEITLPHRARVIADSPPHPNPRRLFHPWHTPSLTTETTPVLPGLVVRQILMRHVD